jgi:hypothetical protein
MPITLNGTTGIAGVDGSAATPAVQGADSNTGMFFPAADTIAFAEGGTEVARFDSSGNFGLGETSPTFKMEVKGTNARLAVKDAGGTYFVRLVANGTFAYTGLEYKTLFTINDDATERARIDSSGNFMVGTTSASALATFEKTTETTPVIVAKNPQYSLDCWATNTTGNNVFVRFLTETSATQRGSITYNRGVGLTAYNTTSDYRSKDIAGEISNASSTVLNLKPYMGTMKGATIERPMFIAHETQDIAPYAVTGEKDAVDNDGNPIYQQMDHSALVPLLTAALQEALTSIQELTARITALEAAQ